MTSFLDFGLLSVRVVLLAHCLALVAGSANEYIADGPCTTHGNTARLRIFNSELGLGKRLKGKG
jgi:hypothetical protein